MAQELVANIQKAIEPQFALLEAKLDAKIESVARDQLFKIVVLVLSSGGLTVGFLSLAFAYFSR